jgi:hypothetical protein
LRFNGRMPGAKKTVWSSFVTNNFFTLSNNQTAITKAGRVYNLTPGIKEKA